MSTPGPHPNSVQAPFTPDEVAALNRYQKSGLHPFTCGNNDHDIAHSTYRDVHGGDYGEMVATSAGWVCPVCAYTQNWAHAMMLNPPENPWMKDFNG